MAPPPAAAPSGPYFAPIPSDSSAVAVSVIPTSPTPPVVSASYFDTNYSVSSPLQFTLSAALFSVPVPPMRYFLPEPSSCVPAGGSTIVLLIPIAAIVAVSVASVTPLAAPSLLHFAPPLSLVLPLLPYPHLCRPSGSCTRLCCPVRLLPRSRLTISPVRMKVSVTRQSGMRHAGQMRAGLRRAVSDLAGPSPW